MVNFEFYVACIRLQLLAFKGMYSQQIKFPKKLLIQTQRFLSLLTRYKSRLIQWRSRMSCVCCENNLFPLMVTTKHNTLPQNSTTER